MSNNNEFVHTIKNTINKLVAEKERLEEAVESNIFCDNVEMKKHIMILKEGINNMYYLYHNLFNKDYIYTYKEGIEEYKNEITFVLDNHIEGGNTKPFANYLYEYEKDYLYSIRYFGATRGHIKVKDNTITEIKIYENTNDVYDNKLEEDLQKYIGKKLKIQK